VVCRTEAKLADQDAGTILGAFVRLLVFGVDLGIDVALLECLRRALGTSLVLNALDKAKLDGCTSTDGRAGENPLIAGAMVAIAEMLVRVVQYTRRVVSVRT
jgi:hypothetical protein